MINFFTFRKDIEEKSIVQNGRRIFNENLIESFRFSNNKNTFKCTAEVSSETNSSQSYSVELLIDSGKIEEFSCHCPYYHNHSCGICKHIIGVLFYIEAHEYYKKKGKNKKKDENEEDFQRLLIDSTLGFDKVNRELECQICLDILHKPILMPCYMHSICAHCCKKMCKMNKKLNKSNEKDKEKIKIACPTCSNNAGIFEIDEYKELKANKELERVITAYKLERNMWFNDKNCLTQQINELKGAVGLEKENKTEKKEETIENVIISLENKTSNELKEIINKCKEIKKRKKKEARLKKEEEKQNKRKDKLKKKEKKRRLNAKLEKKAEMIMERQN